jgi:hypothetical protein
MVAKKEGQRGSYSGKIFGKITPIMRFLFFGWLSLGARIFETNRL